MKFRRIINLQVRVEKRLVYSVLVRDTVMVLSIHDLRAKHYDDERAQQVC